MRKWNTLFTLLLVVVFCGVAANLEAQIKCKIENFSTEDGLSHDNVTSILKDREGFMWFGTWDGINRFDGYNFITYKSYPGDNSKLKNNRIVNIQEDEAGFLWLKAYDNQLYRFDKKTEQFFSIADLLEEQGLRNIGFDIVKFAKDGVVWLTTNNQGIFYLKNTASAHPEIHSIVKEPKTGLDLTSSKISFLFPDNAHTVWLGTSRGLARLTQDKAGKVVAERIISDSLGTLHFTSFAKGTNKIWFGTGEGYLVEFDYKTQRFGKQKVSNSSINSLCLSRKKGILYLTTSQRQLLTVSTATLAATAASLPGSAAFLSVFEDNTGLVWVEPADQGVIKYDPVSGQFKHFVQPKDATFHSSFRVYHIFEDHKKRIWVRMQNGGFGYYDPAVDAIQYFHDEPGSPGQQFSNFVNSSYFDPTGVLWLCTNDRGINKIILQEAHFDHRTLVKNSTNKSDNEVRGMLFDSKNRTWLSSKSGYLKVYQQGKPVSDIFSNLPKDGLGIVYTLIEDSKHNIWLGTKGNGLYKAEPIDQARDQYKLTQFQSSQTIDQARDQYKLTQFQSSQTDPFSLSGDMIHTLFEDSKGRIWVGTYGTGLNLLDQSEGKVRFLNDKNYFQNYPKQLYRRIRHLNETPEGEIWAATTDGLLVIKQPAGEQVNFTGYRKIPGDNRSLGNNDVQFIYKDRKNRMWLCTSGGGLNKVIRGSKRLEFEVFTKENGLPNDYLVSAVEDNNGNLWLATENGLSMFDPETRHFRNYDSYDGLPKTGFSESAAMQLADGRLVFGARNGYLIFNPSEIKKRQVAANMVFTNLQVNNKDVEPGSQNVLLKYSINYTNHIELAYNENIISLEFTVLDHHSSSKQAYAYRLMGFDKEWHQVKNQHKAIYTNLPPGEYAFEVKSLNSDVYEQVPYKKLAITIHPPIWRTFWAYLLYIVLALILLEVIRRVAISMIRLRNRVAVEQKLTELKLRFFTNISHELRTPLTLITNPIEAIYAQEQLSPRGQEYMRVVRKNTNRMVRFINQLLDFRKAQSGKMKLKVAQTEIVALVNEISSHFSEAAAEKQILLQTTSNVKVLHAWVDAEKIDIVLYNLLSNAMKFTPNGKVVTVEINQLNEETFTLKVIDQGIGVPQDKLKAIFELYYEVEDSGKMELNHPGGSGIGLALAKEFIQLHHGKISAVNNPAGGLTVAVTLHNGKAHFQNDKVVFVEAQAGNKETEVRQEPVLPVSAVAAEQAALPLVLLVEDNTDLRSFLADQLSPYYRVVEAEDGEDGFAKAMQQLPDLVISDIMMPRMDGIQMLDKLKNSEATSHIPVILLTAKTSVEHQIEGLNYGADYYITKPFQTDFILASVKNLLAQRRKIFDALLSDKRTLELSPGEVVITSKDEAFLTEVIRIVESGMAAPDFNIDAVAETVGMGRSTFYKKFSSLTNLAPVEFVREMRLKRGKQLLDAGESNISDIAYATGFNSAGYFSTCFKKKYSLTPTEYLKQLKEPQV